jgi:hypothetical protein
MRKKAEVEDALKSAIRDMLALRPLLSVQGVRVRLKARGYSSIYDGILDWHYISRLMRKVRAENLIKLGSEDRTARLVAFKERQRLLTENLMTIVEGDPQGTRFPTHLERIAAANMILKWDMAVLFAEEQIKRIESSPSAKRNRPKTLLVMNATSRSKPLFFESKHGRVSNMSESTL